MAHAIAGCHLDSTNWYFKGNTLLKTPPLNSHVNFRSCHTLSWGRREPHTTIDQRILIRVGHEYAEYAEYADAGENLIHMIHIQREKIVF